MVLYCTGGIARLFCMRVNHTTVYCVLVRQRYYTQQMRPVVLFLKKRCVKTQPDLRLTWGFVHGCYFQNIGQKRAGANFLSKSGNLKSKKCTKSASPQIANSQIFIIISQIVNPSKNTLQLCFKKVLKYMYTCMCKNNKYAYLGTCGSFKSTKRLGPQIANPQNVPFAEGPQI